MSKIQNIDHCWECKEHYDYGGNNLDRCGETGKLLSDIEVIPTWCPLPEDTITTGDNEMSEELKPCPFCGGKAEYHDNATNYDWVFCTVCKAQVPGNYGKQVPRRQWNTRTPPEYKYQKFADYCEESEWSYDKELSFNAARDLKEK